MRQSLWITLLIAIWLSACSQPDTTPPSSTTSAPIEASLPATPTAQAPSATPKPALTAAALEAQATAGPAPTDGAGNWERYTVSLQPEAAADLDLTGLTRYHLSVTLPPDLSALDGTAQILYTNQEQVPLDLLYLHLFPNLWDGGMTVSAVQVDGQAVDATTAADDSLLEVRLPAPLDPGSSVEVSMAFAMAIPTGRGLGNYEELAFDEGILALAHFYPTVVVYDQSWRVEMPAPLGDIIFADASLFEVTLMAPVDLIVAATGATLERTDHQDGTATWHLAGGPMRDFNIVASREFQTASETVGDVRLNSYFRSDSPEGGQQTLAWTTEALRIFEEAFGPYPYTELDIAATTTTAGGVEYPGLIVISAWLYDDPTRRPFFESATAHEVAHQWWYNVVGNDQINHPWLDEALAQYSTYLYYEKAYGERAAAMFEESLVNRWQAVDMIEKPIGLPVAAYPGQEYSGIIYGRGPLFFLELEEEIGRETMLNFLQRYYAEYMWDIATPEAFQDLLERVAGRDLDALFDQWVYPEE